MFKPEVDLNIWGYFEDDRHFAPCGKSVCLTIKNKRLTKQYIRKEYAAVISILITISSPRQLLRMFWD